MTTQQDMLERFRTAPGFIAALDQSGGSTPKTLVAFGYEEGSWSGEEEMFGLIHDMRERILTSPSMTGDKILGVILFERTMDGLADGKPVPEFLNGKSILPFVKVDKGLEDEAEGVQMMKPMPALDTLLERAKGLGVFGTKMRSVIKSANATGIAANVAQQFEIGTHIAKSGLMPILEPEYDIKAADRPRGEAILRDEIAQRLDDLPDDVTVALKLSLPAEPGFYAGLAEHPRVARVVALSGGYDRDEACEKLARNPAMIASFSRALLEGLNKNMSDEEFDAALARSIDQIYRASVAASA